MKKRVYLVGYMGSGKSAVGKKLSFATKWPLYDMDDEIERKAGMPIPEIFAKYGEQYFRDLETAFLRDFKEDYCIIATGGGVAMREENRKIMKETGLVFFLNAPFRDIWQRIATDVNRPIVQSSTREELEKLYEERKPNYFQAGHIKVKTERRSLTDIATYIAFQMDRLQSK